MKSVELCCKLFSSLRSSERQSLYWSGTSTDLKIDWIWHLLINVLRILKPEIS